MPKKHMKRHERADEIERVLLSMVDSGQKPEATAYTLARVMDMQVSYVLYAVLADMVAQHRLTVRDEVIPNRCTRTFYSLPEGTYEYPKKREIKINGKLWYTQERMI